VKVGDLVKALTDCGTDRESCACWFCYYDSSRIGYVLGISDTFKEGDERRWTDKQMWDIIFDAGVWEVYEHEVEVISD